MKINFSLCSLLTAFFLCNYTEANSWNLQTEMNENGEVACVWENYDGTFFDLQTRTISNTGVLSSVTELEASLFSIDSKPTLSINNSGKIAIAWTVSNHTLGATVLYMNYFDGTTWQSSAIQVSENTESVADNYSIYLSDTDWLVVTWSSYSHTLLTNIVRVAFGPLGNLGAPQTLG
jgi:hypothetical protein